MILGAFWQSLFFFGGGVLEGRTPSSLTSCCPHPAALESSPSGQSFTEPDCQSHSLGHDFEKCHQANILYKCRAHFMRSFLECLGFPGGSQGKESACNAGDPGLIPGLGKSSGEVNGYPLQYSCLENSMDRGAWGATVYGVTDSQTRLSD